MAYGTYSFSLAPTALGTYVIDTLTSPDLGSHQPAWGIAVVTGYDDVAGGNENNDAFFSFGVAIDADQISTPGAFSNRGEMYVASLNPHGGVTKTADHSFGIPPAGSGSEWCQLGWTSGVIMRPYEFAESPFFTAPDVCKIEYTNFASAIPTQNYAGFIAAGGFGDLEGGCTRKVSGTLNFATTLTPVSVTGLGFTPDFVILMCGNYFVNGVAQTQANSTFSLGICANDGSQTQRALSFGEQTAQTNGNPKEYLSTSNGIVIQDFASSAVLFSAQVTSFDAGGFTMTPTFISPGETHTRFCGWLAVKLHEGSCKLIDYTTPTVTGSHATTGVGFTPSMCIAVMGSLTSTNASVGPSNDSGGISVSTFTSGAQWAGGMRVEAGVPPNTASFRSQKAMQVPVGNLINSIVAQFTSFDVDGFTLNFTTADGSARKGFVLALGAEAACSSPPPPPVPIVPGAATSYVRVWGNYP